MKKIVGLIVLSISSLTFAQSNSTKNLFDEFNQLKKSKEVTKEYKEEINEQIKTIFNGEQFSKSNFDTNRSQYFMLVDASTNKQNMFLAYWDSSTKTVEYSDKATKVSTGGTPRVDYYTTPIGFFEQKAENGTYRAQGTKNEHGIRGYGVKGMRVWDFGWQKGYTNWLKNPELRDIRLQMHATDPDQLEPLLGTPRSKACVRIAAEVNKFIDHNGILDKNVENDTQLNYVLPKDRYINKESGSFVVVVNTSKK
jgi:hypothetical protein